MIPSAFCCYASPVYAVVVCPSVAYECLSQVSIVTKAKRRITKTTPYNSREICSFLTLKISAKFQWRHTYGGAKYRCGRLKSAILE